MLANPIPPSTQITKDLTYKTGHTKIYQKLVHCFPTTSTHTALTHNRISSLDKVLRSEYPSQATVQTKKRDPLWSLNNHPPNMAFQGKRTRDEPLNTL